MGFYVLALTRQRLRPATVGGRTYRSLALGQVVAVGERRLRAPLAVDEELRRQHAAVLDIASKTDAVLPVRFGTLMAAGDLVSIVARNEEAILRALDDVRGRVQMTVRFVSGAAPPSERKAPLTGRGYLEQKRRASAARIPAAGKRLLSALAPFVRLEKRAPGTGRLLATVYHLVDAQSVAEYLEVAGSCVGPGIVVTGPLPPYAFAPSVL